MVKSILGSGGSGGYAEWRKPTGPPARRWNVRSVRRCVAKLAFMRSSAVSATTAGQQRGNVAAADEALPGSHHLRFEDDLEDRTGMSDGDLER